MLNVFIVDDALVIRKNLRKFFTNLGHNVVGEAQDGNEALEKCEKIDKIDLVTMDITMPGMDGIETTTLMKEIKPDVTVTMITSHGQEEYVAEALKAGARNFILKPITEEKLSESISELFPS